MLNGVDDLKSPSDDRDGRPYQCWATSPAYGQKLNLPYFAKATEGFSLSSALVTEEIYVQAGTEAEALAFTDFNKPRRAGGEGLSVDAFRHEKNSIGGDFGKL